MDALPANPYPRWSRRAAALGAIGAGLLLVGAVGVGPALAIPGLLIGLFSGVLAFAFWIAGRQVEAELARWRAGQALASWDLSPDRFAPWWAARRVASRRGALAAGACVMLAACVFAGLAREDGETQAARIAVGVGLAGAAGLVAVLRLMEPRPPSGGPVRVIIGRDGGFVGGELVWWRGYGIRPVRAEVAPGPALRVVYRVATQSGEAEHVCVIPAPPEALLEVEQAAARVQGGLSPD